MLSYREVMLEANDNQAQLVLDNGARIVLAQGSVDSMKAKLSSVKFQKFVDELLSVCTCIGVIPIYMELPEDYEELKALFLKSLGYKVRLLYLNGTAYCVSCDYAISEQMQDTEYGIIENYVSLSIEAHKKFKLWLKHAKAICSLRGF